MSAILSVIPVVVVLGLMFRRFHMVLAGLIGGVLAMLIGHIGIPQANKIFLDAIPSLLGASVTVPIINSAVATAVFKSGGYNAALTLAKRAVKGRSEYLAVFIVLLQALATYMSGIGGGSAMVIAPLAFAAVGVIPELVAGMSIAAAAGFVSSPASLETSVVTKLGNIPADAYVATMRPYWLVFTVLAMALAFWGAKRRGSLATEAKTADDAKTDEMSTGELWKTTIPVLFLLFAVIVGPFINKAVGFAILGPLVYTVVTVILIALCTKFNWNESFAALINGSDYILKALFSVGIFVAFMNMIGEVGAFKVIAGIANAAPAVLVVPAAVIGGFLVGWPAGAYVGSVLTMVLPVGVALHFSPLALGFVALGVAFGSQISFVNITMQALSAGFQIPIQRVVTGNLRWVLGCLGLLLVLSLIFA
ncbi:MAG TPA: hypothetical protein VK464_07195 [Symbiobacteriaceae bacterium]|nr:hypothetical protein [Symbiobacteriaceae bacterium]